MGKYIVKRILLMIPTFFAISVIVFLVMHAAPGQPGASVQGAGDASQDADQGAENEAYTLFKQQFNLDKPILLNMRFADTQEEVRDWLREVSHANLLGLYAEAVGRKHCERLRLPI